MKKLMAGCLIVAVIAGAAFGVALYFGYRAVRPMFGEAASWLGQARDIAAQSGRVANRTEFEPPGNGELTEDQVRRYLAVHDRVRKTLGERWTDLEARARSLEDRAREGNRNLSLSEIGAMLTELGDLVVDARRAHVDALNAEKFSSSEYAWVRLRVYEAAGLEAARGIDWSGLEALIKKGTEEVGLPAPADLTPDIPERNRELVKPHLEALQAWLPLTVFGF